MASGEVVLIGGSGFVGSRLCRRLKGEGRAFSIIDRRPSAAFPGRTTVADVGSPAALEGALPTGATVVNLAAEHRDDVTPVERYAEVNVGGAEAVCEAAARQQVIKLLFASSAAVYGDAPRNTDESGAVQPTTPYGASKAAAEEVYRAWQAEDPGQRTLVIVRPTAIFGEGGRGNANLLLRQLAASRFVMVGDGRHVKSLAYVENVAAFLAHVLKLEGGIHIYNYVDKPDLTMMELVRFVRQRLERRSATGIRVPVAVARCAGVLADAASKLTGRALPISAARVRKFCTDTQFDSAAPRTGFVAPVSLLDGLQATLDHIVAEELHRGG